MYRFSPVIPIIPITAIAVLLMLAGQAGAGAAVDPLELRPVIGDPIVLTGRDHQSAGIRVDGVLDEAVWSEVEPIDAFVVLEPDTLAAPPHRTEVRFVYTQVGLYVAFDLEQPADTLLKRFTLRDDRETVRDYVSMTIDTSGTGLYGYYMNLALGDNQTDGTVLPERRFSSDWDGAWYGATAVTERGWSAEFYLPWSNTAMPRTQATRRMGLYLSRKVGYLNQRWGWPALPQSRPTFMSDMYPVEMDGVNPRQQWSFIPYASGTRDLIDDETEFKAGFDLFWRPSTNFQLTGTLNPDFGTVEADDVTVNLTADETFFPEKRLFFLEGQEIFETSPRSRTGYSDIVKLVNTRRVGGRSRTALDDADVPLPPRAQLNLSELYGAAKATGQMGQMRYGLLAASEQDTTLDGLERQVEAPGRDFLTGRVLFENRAGGGYRALGYVGTLVAHPDEDAVVHGIDYHYQTRSGRWTVDGQLIFSDLDLRGEGFGTFADLSYAPRQGLKHTLAVSYYDDTVDINDFGFLRRNDATDIWYRMEWIRSDVGWVRDFAIRPFARVEVNGDGYRTNTGFGGAYAFTRHNLHTISGSIGYFPERYDDRNSFGNGTFRTESRPSANIQYETDTSRVWSGFVKVGYMGETSGGRILEGAAGFTFRPPGIFSLGALVEVKDRKGWLLHQGGPNMTSFDAVQLQPAVNADLFLSARQHLRLALQWAGVRAEEREFFEIDQEDVGWLIPVPKPPGPTDDFSLSQLSFQVRYRWQIAPLSDLYVVYTKADSRRYMLMDFDELLQQSWEEPLGEQLVVKLRYRFGS